MSCCGGSCGCNKTTSFQKVVDFKTLFKMVVNQAPTVPDEETVILNLELVVEEVKELLKEFGLEMRNPSIEVKDVVKWNNKSFSLDKITKELVDINYVVYGMGAAFGLPMDEGFNAVHASNLTKLDENGQPIFREDGKVLKSHLYKEPDMVKVLEESF